MFVIGVCMLILYPALPDNFVSCKSFLLESLRGFIHIIILIVNKDNLNSSFPAHIPFISFSCVITVAKIFSAILNRIGETRHPCLVPAFSGDGSSFSLFSMMLAIVLLLNCLYYVDVYVLCIPNFSSPFIMKRC